MSNDVQSTTFSPQKPMPQSPWKKPNRVSLSKAKSLKRKSELLANLNDSNSSNSSFKLDPNENNPIDGELDSQKQPKTRKTIFSRFSINNTSLNFSYGFGSPNASDSPARTSFNNSLNYDNSKSEDKNDLYSFFSGSKPKLDQVEESNRIINDEKILLNKQKLNEKLLSSSEFISRIYSTSSNKSLIDQANESGVEKKEKYLFENENLIPIDWSLKIRARYSSTEKFTCYSGIRSQHETEALLNYSRFDMFYNNLNNSKNKTSSEKNDLFKTLLCESISYWSFPNLPWLNLYPRNVSASNVSEPLNPNAIQGLSRNWTQAFQSLYNSLKCNQCPYFYLLTQQFTVLFRAQNINGIQEMHAILTPSTKGLREQIQKDSNFTMPLMNNRKSDQFDETTNDCTQPEAPLIAPQTSNDNSLANINNETNPSSVSDASNLVNSDDNSNSDEFKKPSNKKTEDEDDNDSDDSDEPDEWLEQIGLNSAVNFKSSVLQRNNKNTQNKDLNFDNRPKSTLLFDNAGDVQGLFNFLLNLKNCVASCGALMGVPPTLLSPLPFVNSTLQKLKVEQNLFKDRRPDGEPFTTYVLDFIGPVMPYHIHRLCNLFRMTQSGNFEMSSVPFEQSVALNSVKYYTKDIIDFNSDSEDKDTNLNNQNNFSKYLDSSEMKSLENQHGLFGEPKAVRTISCKNDMFYCN